MYIDCSLLTLYLPGGPVQRLAPRPRWQSIENRLRLAQASLESAQSELSSAGFWLEASMLGAPGVLQEAERLVLRSQVLVAGADGFPIRWLGLLGRAAPPVLWMTGNMPIGSFLTIVGSRFVNSAARSFARETASTAVEQGFVVASGGAEGCDHEAARGALSASREAGVRPRLVELVPYGLSHCGKVNHCVLSLSPPLEPFSSAAAMERNTLLYAMSERSVVAHARLREGGSWQGASSCLRRRLSQVFIRDDGSSAARALQALGALPASGPEDVFKEASPAGLQSDLRFG